MLTNIVKGIVAGCKESGCSLTGGETAEMPSFYKDGEYDVAGFVVGVVEKDKIIDGSDIAVGDKIIGIASSGIHSNGLSLARNVLFDKLGMKVGNYVHELGCTIGEELLKPTKIYVKTILNLLRDFQIQGIAHITGGGLVENVARILPDGCRADIKTGCWDIPPVFDLIKTKGSVDEDEMLKTFNNGIGMVVVVKPGAEEEILLRLNALNEKAFIIGNIRDSK
jgi:phosphoribosylformylglycinamidine cyclo-ligase